MHSISYLHLSNSRQKKRGKETDLMENYDAPGLLAPSLRRCGAWQPWSAPHQIPLRIALRPFLLLVIA